MAENCPFGIPFLTPKIPLQKFRWVPFLRSFPGNEAHRLSLGAQNGAVWVGAKNFMLKKFMFATGMQWTGLPDRNTDQIGKKAQKMSKICLCRDFGQFSDIFGTFFSTFCHDSVFLGCPTICPLQVHVLFLSLSQSNELKVAKHSIAYCIHHLSLI